MKKTFLLAVLFSAFACVAFAQPDDESANSKIYVGGNIGLNFGNNYVNLDIAPHIGYWVTPKLDVGAGVSINYLKYNANAYTLYGGRLFANYHIFQGFFAHAEFEGLNRPTNYTETGRQWVFALPVGIGYSKKLAPKLYGHVMVLWNLIKTTPPVYYNPIIRGGINYRL